MATEIWEINFFSEEIGETTKWYEGTEMEAIAYADSHEAEWGEYTIEDYQEDE